MNERKRRETDRRSSLGKERCEDLDVKDSGNPVGSVD